MGFFKEVTTSAVAPVINLVGAVKINSLKSSKLPRVAVLARAVDEGLRRKLAPDERHWIRAVESLRDELNHSKQEIVVTDYGAGDPDINRSGSEMFQGILSKTTVGAASSVSKAPFWAMIISKLIRYGKPKICIEMGTCVGISGAYIANQLKARGQGQLYTLEGSRELADLAKANFANLKLDNVEVVTGRFSDTLPGLLEQVRQVDFAFVDGHHEEQATIQYFEQLKPYLGPDAIMVFDDIKWSAGMRNAWQHIMAAADVKFALDLRSIGICLVQADMEKQAPVSIPLLPRAV